MKISNLKPEDIIFSLDIGTRSIIGTVGVVSDKKFNVVCEEYVEHQERAMIDGQIHDITLVANGVNSVKKALENELGFKLDKVSIAAAGRFLRTTVKKVEIESDPDTEIDRETIRSLELTAVKAAENDINEQSQGKLYCVGYSVINYYLNGYVISNLLSHKGEKIAAEVIATFLPRSVVDSLYSVMDKVGLTVTNLTLEPIAAMEAAIPQSLRLLNLALVDIGAGTSDIAISSKDTISAYGMVPLAGDEVTEALAQSLLVDFNTAEKVKRSISPEKPVSFTDVIGIENKITYEEMMKIINPVVIKIATETGKRIIELNGGKAPNAVFLVGGGAHTPGLKEAIADYIKLPPQRIAIKGRDAVTECVCSDNSLGSTGVTVLGIALISIKKMGHDFIDVTLNGSVISLFNSHKHTVMDTIIQAGLNPKVLMGKNGKNIKFVLNGRKRVAFGTLAKSASIKINGKERNIDTEVSEGDNIEIEFAKDGENASPRVKDYIQEINSISFSIDNNMVNLEPIVFINDKKVDFETEIRENDNISIIYPEKLEDYKKYYDDGNENFKYYSGNTEIDDNYIIKDGDRIFRVLSGEKYLEESKKAEVKSKDNEVSSSTEIPDAAIKEHMENKKVSVIEVYINDEKVKIKSDKKDSFVFVDIFDFIDFDLTRVRGNLVLTLNDKPANYLETIKTGDNIKVYWK